MAEPKANEQAENVTKFARDVMYVGIGFGVIAFQKVQVRRREMLKQYRGQVDGAKSQLGSVSNFVEGRVKLVGERLGGLDDRVGAVLDNVGERLPEPARDVAQQLRKVAKGARSQGSEPAGHSNGHSNGTRAPAHAS